MEAELEEMRKTQAWAELQKTIADHGKNVQHALSVHTSTCCQPRKQTALVPSLEVAGLRGASKQPDGKWILSLELPDLYAPNDGCFFKATIAGVSKAAIRRDLQTMSTTTSPRT